MFNFEKLELWQKSTAFAGSIYDRTPVFPSDERFGLTNQMRRASVSISSTLAEGRPRGSRANCGRFVEIATGSTFEVVSPARIANNCGWLHQPEHDQLQAGRLDIVRMLSRVRSSLDS